MAFIVKKKIGGKEYYYLRESKRVDGKVRALTIAYLGKTKKEAEERRKEIEGKLSERVRNDKQFSGSVRDDKLSESMRDNKQIVNKAINRNSNSDKDMDNKKMEEKKKDNSKEGEFLSFVQEGGLIWGPEPEIYGGLAGFYTYGPIGKLLKNKVENSVRRVFNSNGFRELEGPTVMPDVVWKASGHLGTFADRIIKCKKCKSVFRADKLIEEKYDVSADAFSDEKILSFIKEKGIKCPSCDSELEMHIEKQSLMMKTIVGGVDASLRPETATVTYLPFLRAYNYFRKKLPFGVYQIGKAYRNEISPRQGVLRGREFTQAEGQIFIDPLEKNNWEKFEGIAKEKLPFWHSHRQKNSAGIEEISIEEAFERKFVKSKAYAWCLWLAYNQFVKFGIPKDRIRLRQHADDEKAFYADDAWDIEIKMKNYGWIEVCGIHDRTDYDLKQHSEASGMKLEAIRENGEKFIPHILEIAFGTDRPTYSLIDLFYEKKQEGEGKTTFKIPYHMAPIDVAVFPLMKKPELLEVSESVQELLEKEFVVDYDTSGSIGKRYLRAGIAGVPFCITIDYDSLEKKDVTIRDRDSEKQVRVKINELREIIGKLLKSEMRFEELDAKGN